MPSNSVQSSFNARSQCPICRSLEILGDKWTLLIIRDMLVGKRRFKEFLDSDESITTNILTDRLNRLLAHEVVEKRLSEEDSRYPEYRLTPRGEELQPLLGELVKWSMAHVEGSILPEGTPWS